MTTLLASDIKNARPFLKWAGGKGQLLTQLDRYLPRQHKEGPFTYIEPFIGGGAMLFHVLREHDNIKRAVINDINPNLATAYRTIRDKAGELIECLSDTEQCYLNLDSEDDKKDFFLKARKTFNEEALNDVERTSFLLFLNRTCFNGLYRENSKGKFNVPFGYYKHPTICNRETILADSEILNRKEVVILNGDFEGVRKYMDSEGVNIVYFDPPYRPLNATSSFNSYVKQGFGDEEQTRLRNFATDIATSGNVYWMISNSDCSAKNPEDLFFETLYKDFHINRVYASRAINANPSKRGKLTELLICNYGPENFSEDNQMEQSLF